jgi:hypothetical protein
MFCTLPVAICSSKTSAKPTSQLQELGAYANQWSLRLDFGMIPEELWYVFVSIWVHACSSSVCTLYSVICWFCTKSWS